MESDLAIEKELFRHIGLLSNEVIQVQKTLQSINSQESRLRAALDELTLDKEILLEQMGRLETMVRQCAAAAVEEDEREQEHLENLEGEKNDLRKRLTEMEESLQLRELRLRDLENEMAARVEEFTAQLSAKESQIQIRDTVVADLKAATNSLNRLVDSLSSAGARSTDSGEEVPALERAPDTTAALKDVEDRMSMEIERLKNVIREKDAMLSARSLEVEMTKQSLGSRIEDLENSLDTQKRKKKSPRIVSMLSDIGGKRLF